MPYSSFHPQDHMQVTLGKACTSEPGLLAARYTDEVVKSASLQLRGSRCTVSEGHAASETVMAKICEVQHIREM